MFLAVELSLLTYPALADSPLSFHAGANRQLAMRNWMVSVSDEVGKGHDQKGYQSNDANVRFKSESA